MKMSNPWATERERKERKKKRGRLMGSIETDYF